MPTPCADDQVAVEIQMYVELSKEAGRGPFSVALIRQETQWWDDDPAPDVVEALVCETEIQASLPAVFAAVEDWLVRGHRLRVVPSSWELGSTGPGTGLVFLLTGRALPLRS